MKYLDKQLAAFKTQLEEQIGLTAEESTKVSTLVAADVRFLPPTVKAEIVAASPVPLGLRLDELVAFQKWSELASSIKGNPAVTRAQVIVQNYICFVYLKDACFEVLARRAPNGSVAARCAGFLSRGAVRDFRNAFAHANWCYNANFTGLQCWVLQDVRRKDGPIRHFEVFQQDLNFWQALSRSVAYATYEQLRD
jgi:hypothetical protein